MKTPASSFKLIQLPVIRTSRARLFPMLSACVLFFICHLTLAAEPSLLSIGLNKELKILGLKVPLGQHDNTKPTVSLFFGEISVESKRFGFLRIGPIPQPVACGMRVEILEPEGGVGWASDFAQFAAAEPALEHMDIRGIEFHSSIKDVVSVRADAAQFVPLNRTLRLRMVEVHAEGQPIRRFKEAEVYLEGTKAGQLEWHEGALTHGISLNGPAPALAVRFGY